MRNLLTIVLISLCCFGCTHALHLYHVEAPEEFSRKGEFKRIKATGEQFVVMGFVTQTDYVNAAYDQLKSKCPGKVTGIHTRYSTSHSFFSWTNKVQMTGYCVE